MDWIVTAQTVGTRVVDGHEAPWPSSVAHARTAGADVAECGRSVTSWGSIWALEFPVVGAPTCPVCLRSVAIARAELAQSGTRLGNLGSAVSRALLRAQGREAS
jgi:hypothetical protein